MSKITRLLAGFVVLLAACGDGGGKGKPPPTVPPVEQPPVAAAISKSAGDGQEQTISTALPTPLRVKVTAADGRAVPNVAVTWAVTAGGGQLSAASSTTDSNGEASVTWTLGSASGAQTVSATAAGFQAGFTAKALAFYTVLVYMAADNNLSWDGVDDIDEMEKVGSSDSVNIVVQAEFSPEETRMEGCGPSCFNRPNYNTFRYRVTKPASGVQGPDGAATDIGNRNMATGAELADFIAWGKATYPAQKYVLVLWNHGGGYVGLIEDATSNGNGLMSLATLRTALQTANTRFAVVNFDMCLMGGAETMVTMEGFADYLAYSQEVEPGQGDPYDLIMGRLRSNPRMSGGELAAGIATDFVASYAGTRNSVTKSAVDMGQMPAFLAAWNSLADELRTNLDTHAPALNAVIPQTQAYAYAQLRDLGDFLTRMRAASSSQALHARIDAVRAQYPAVVVANKFRTANASRAPNVNGSTGMHVLLPSRGGTAGDALPGSGPASLNSYKALYPNLGWTSFINQWLTGPTGNTRGTTDQGEGGQLQVALVWEEEAVTAGADVDFWVLEPNGNIYIPYLGVVTPNGTFGGDSQESGSYYEIYTSRRYVEPGTYHFFAELWADPNNFMPYTTVLYREATAQQWQDLYGDDPMLLTKFVEWGDDPTPTLQEAVDGAYTDLQYAAYWEVDVAAAAHAGTSQNRTRPAMSRSAGRAMLSRLPAAQVNRVNQLLRDPQVRAQRAAARARVRPQSRAGSAVPAGIRANERELGGSKERP
jgi:hypothetical protein